LVPSETVTVEISEKGCVRAAKGHEVDPAGLSYKAGEGFCCAARGRSNQLAVFIDSTGRAYALPAHSLPSARGQGEPLTGRLSPPDGAHFVGVMAGDADQRYLLATDAGYGFIARLGDLYARNKGGKVVLSVPKGARVLKPVPMGDPDSDRIAALSNTGRLLVFPAAELPALAKGKGNKILAIPAARVAARDEYVLDLACVPPSGTLLVHAGKRHLKLKGGELDDYLGERGRRGSRLPRGFQKVAGLAVEGG
ncbi:MAG: DNA gyrase C-terminal beta-propeller domain-containing protein, partial [Gammaproteobacteria bacterium]